ncbi:vancomycin high temperature exclusion protein [Pendulispora albinea]|uniref:YdcF family protein n=1 Tax=Pendulispora albinea TaxID=2741071 RepID=A0ABZ2MA72_9BACT
MKRKIAAGVSVLLAVVVALNVFVWRVGKAGIVDGEGDAIVVLGAGVYPDGQPSAVLVDRLATALSLYRAGRAPKILVTGDHGRPSYDEPGAMRRWLEHHGVPTEAIFMDHAGFDTFSSMTRARRVFGIERPIVVTQAFHLPRALYLARSSGMAATGVIADRRAYRGALAMRAREMVSAPKAWLDVTTGREPRYLGPRIPIDGDGRVTHDM